MYFCFILCVTDVKRAGFVFSLGQVFHQCNFTAIETNHSIILAKSIEQDEPFVTAKFNFLL